MFTLLESVCRRMASDANGATTNFHVVPPPQRPGSMDPYDLYDMDEVDEEEMKEVKKDALAWLQEQAHCVYHYCNLTHGSRFFVTSCNMLLALVAGRTMKSRGRNRALEEYLCTDPCYATVRHGYPWVPTDQAHGCPRQVGPAY
jgi:hypothetical protein